MVECHQQSSYSDACYQFNRNRKISHTQLGIKHSRIRVWRTGVTDRSQIRVHFHFAFVMPSFTASGRNHSFFSLLSHNSLIRYKNPSLLRRLCPQWLIALQINIAGESGSHPTDGTRRGEWDIQIYFPQRTCWASSLNYRQDILFNSVLFPFIPLHTFYSWRKNTLIWIRIQKKTIKMILTGSLQ